jgi:hypothetical protein
MVAQCKTKEPTIPATIQEKDERHLQYRLWYIGVALFRIEMLASRQISRTMTEPSGCSMPGIISLNPSLLIGDRLSDSQNNGDSVFSGMDLYSPCALRRKYIVRDFCRKSYVVYQSRNDLLTYYAALLQSIGSEEVPQCSSSCRRFACAQQSGVSKEES